MMTCVIVDDEPYALKLLEEYAARLPEMQVVKKYHHALEALEYLRVNHVDVVFLDVSMPKLSGMQLAKLIRPNQKVVFTTAFSEHAVESYSVNTIDYLLKPIQFEVFLRAVEKVKAYVMPTQLGSEIWFVKSGKAFIRLTYDEILFIEGMKDYVLFHTKEKKHIVYKRMKELETKLPAEFRRIHLSYIVNVKHMSRLEDNHVYLSGERLPIGEKYRQAFFDFLRGQTM